MDLGIERIEPGHPEQNGRHERMHLTLKQETTRPPRENLVAQQEEFDKFIRIYGSLNFMVCAPFLEQIS